MQILNLAHPDEGNLKYVLTKFPDGEPHIKIISEINHKDEVEVYTRICNSDDLFVLLQVGDILKRHEVTWDLHIAYLMSMRMDRVIDFNRPFSLKIIANLINSLSFTRISILEPHSNMSEKFFYDRLLPYYGKIVLGINSLSSLINIGVLYFPMMEPLSVMVLQILI